MATPALIVVVSVALLSLLALGLTVLTLLRHLRGLTATLAQVQQDLEPSLTALAADADVTRAELERVAAATDALAEQRRDRR